MNPIADPATQAALWTRARSMCVRAVEAIGEPASLAVRVALSRATKRGIAGWLARLESIVRKLLLALAVALLSETRSSPQAQVRAGPPRANDARSTVQKSRVIDITAPQTWSARFALAPPHDPRAVPERRAPRIRALWGPSPPAPPPPVAPGPRHITEPALRFAFRLEALKRVLADPLPYARRVVRIFSRLLRRYPEAAHRYAVAPARPHASDEGDPRLIIDVLSLAMAAAHLFPNTS